MRKLLVLSVLVGWCAWAQSQTPTKPAVLPIWASGATPTTDIVQPINSYITQGWPLSSTPPSRQYFNWLDNYLFDGIRYLSKRGIADWDVNETYTASDVVQGPNGTLFRQTSLTPQTGNTPTFPSTIWGPITTVTAFVGDNSPNVATTAFVHNNYIPIGGAFSLLGGQLANNQVPLAAITQWQSSLSINWLQISNAPLSISSVASTIAERDSSGNLAAIYFQQQSANNENPPIGQFIVQTGTDSGFDRKAGIGYVQSQMPLSSFAGQVSAAQVPTSAVTQYEPQIFTYNPLVSKAQNGCSELPGGIILMWGVANPNGGSVTVNFPCGGFPNVAFSVVTTSTGTPTQSNVTSLSRLQFTVFNTGGQSYWMATGD